MTEGMTTMDENPGDMRTFEVSDILFLAEWTFLSINEIGDKFVNFRGDSWIRLSIFLLGLLEKVFGWANKFFHCVGCMYID